MLMPFDIIKDVYESKFTWKQMMMFGMEYNRGDHHSQADILYIHHY